MGTLLSTMLFLVFTQIYATVIYLAEFMLCLLAMLLYNFMRKSKSLRGFFFFFYCLFLGTLALQYFKLFLFPIITVIDLPHSTSSCFFLLPLLPLSRFCCLKNKVLTVSVSLSFSLSPLHSS